jgi:predicted TIM-barrel fold metal-dependent hydrolase
MVSQATNADWLALTVEEPLEPDLPICDPHHHLWDLRPARVAPRYLLDEILSDVQSGHNVVAKLGGLQMEVHITSSVPPSKDCTIMVSSLPQTEAEHKIISGCV